MVKVDAVSELAGNLKAELNLIRDDHKNGRITNAIALKRIEAIRRYRQTVQRRRAEQIRLNQCVTGRLFA